MIACLRLFGFLPLTDQELLMIRYPSPGCIVEYIEGNAVQIAIVMNEAGEKLKLLLPSRREVTLGKNRILPWIGPLYEDSLRREDCLALMEKHRLSRLETEKNIAVLELWQMVQGEVKNASAEWFVELSISNPSIDVVAAFGHALLACKTHFRFCPPVFQIYSAEEADKREAEQKIRAERESLLQGGKAFLHMLWEVALGRRKLVMPEKHASPSSEWPSPEIQARIETLLRKRMADPNDSETDPLWKQIARSLPDAPQMPLQLLLAWGKVPAHYNVWLDQAGYAADDLWWKECADEVERLLAALQPETLDQLPLSHLPFVSIDSESTRDIDDAFFLEPFESGWHLTLALAYPSFAWHFGGGLDLKVRERGTSLYLPEKTSHMLPECIGAEGYSLKEGKIRPAFLLTLHLDSLGNLVHCEPSFARVRVAANLSYRACEAVLEGQSDAAATPFLSLLQNAFRLATLLREKRIENGAILMERPEPIIRLEGEGAQTRVFLEQEPCTKNAQCIVSEYMIAASSACAEWAIEQGVPLLFRTQAISLPHEMAGMYSAPEEIAKVIRFLMPSLLETKPAPHAALACQAYAPITSPLRRYADFVNVAQIAHYCLEGQARFPLTELESLLTHLAETLDRVGQIQRYRPRYWKLLFFLQQGDAVWWDGIITEIHDGGVSVVLPAQAMLIRAKRALFDDRAHIGTHVRVRVGKVHPLWNEIQIVEAVSL